jgi:hypothetical protein
MKQNRLYFITSSGGRASRRPGDETKKHVLQAEQSDTEELWTSSVPVTGLCPGFFPCCGPGIISRRIIQRLWLTVRLVARFYVIVRSSFSRERKKSVTCNLGGRNLQEHEGLGAEGGYIIDCLLCAVCRNLSDILSSWKYFSVCMCSFSIL